MNIIKEMRYANFNQLKWRCSEYDFKMKIKTLSNELIAHYAIKFIYAQENSDDQMLWNSFPDWKNSATWLINTLTCTSTTQWHRWFYATSATMPDVNSSSITYVVRDQVRPDAPSLCCIVCALVPVQVLYGAVVAHLCIYLCGLSLQNLTVPQSFVPSQCVCGTILVTLAVYDVVRLTGFSKVYILWVLRSGPMLFYMPKRPWPFQSSMFP